MGAQEVGGYWGTGGSEGSVWYEIDPLCMKQSLSEIKDDAIKVVILATILMYLLN